MSALGGGFQGISPQQTINCYKTTEDIRSRKIVVKSFNKPAAIGTMEGKNRRIGPYRAVMNLGDFLSRENYSCGGSNQHNSRPNLHGLRNLGRISPNCDGTNIPASWTNVKYVSDSSDYIRFLKLRSTNRTYNDPSL